jgi:hypothetical protein
MRNSGSGSRRSREGGVGFALVPVGDGVVVVRAIIVVAALDCHFERLLKSNWMVDLLEDGLRYRDESTHRKFWREALKATKVAFATHTGANAIGLFCEEINRSPNSMTVLT